MKETEWEKAARRTRLKQQLAVGVMWVTLLALGLLVVSLVVSLFILSWKVMLCMSVVVAGICLVAWALENLPESW